MYGFLSFVRTFSNKCRRQLLDTGLGSLETASRNVFHKAGEFLGNKIIDAVTKPNDDKIVEPVE